MKRIAGLLLVAFVFTGAWWDEKKPATSQTTVTQQVETTTVEDDEPQYEAVAEKTTRTASQTVAPAAAGAAGSDTANALKILSQGSPDERKARMESLVRLSNALKKQRELKQEEARDEDEDRY